MTNKEKLDSYLMNNYNKLLKVSYNVTNRLNGRIKYDLLHEIIISMYERLDRHNEYLKSNDDFVRYSTNYIKQFYEWQKSTRFNCKKDNKLFTYIPNEDELNINNYYYITDTNSEQLIYINSENTNIITKLFLKDMLLNDIQIDRAIMVNNIISASKQLNEFEKEIFDLYFLQDMNCRKIYGLIKDIKPVTYQNILDLKNLVHTKILDKLKTMEN